MAEEPKEHKEEEHKEEEHKEHEEHKALQAEATAAGVTLQVHMGSKRALEGEANEGV